MMSESQALNQGSTVLGNHDIVMERVYNAPRGLLFQVFTQPEHLSQWWAPLPFPVPVCSIDLRPGGRWHYAMRSPLLFEFETAEEMKLYVDSEMIEGLTMTLNRVPELLTAIQA